MDPATYWKNFDLGTELSIAAGFIYDGLNQLDKIDHFQHSDELFPVLYNLSVGLERILKIAILLAGDESFDDQEAFEESLITHSHSSLVERLNEKFDLNLQATHNEFVSCLAKFYKSFRYGRFTQRSVYDREKEKGRFTEWLQKHLCKPDCTEPLPNDEADIYRIRKFVGKTTGTIIKKVYAFIEDEARKQNIYTYEIRYTSKAAKLFLFQQYDFFDEEILRGELILHLIERYRTVSPAEALGIELVEFDAPSLKAFRSDRDKLEFHGELEHFYEEYVDDPKRRMELMRYLPEVIESALLGEVDEEE